MPNRLHQMFQALSRFGTLPEDTEDVRISKSILSVGGLSTALALIFLFAPVYFLYGEPRAGFIYLGFASFVIVNILLFGFWHKDYRATFLVLACCALPAHWLGAIELGGFVNSHGVLLWGLFFPVLSALIYFNLRHAIFWFVIYGGGIAAIVFLTPSLRAVNNIPPLVAQFLLAQNILISSAFALGMMMYFVAQRDLAFRLLRGEQEKSERLLLNILPADIAALLKEDDQTIADHYEGASILFADVVDFTPMSAQLQPTELVNLLNELFSELDQLVEAHGLEKIKTIGDAYMVAAGVPRPRKDHAHALARLALDIRDLVSRREFSGRKITFRIGINSGPVVAGVIGRKKFIYDLWGDAVNTASRMESHGQPNTIQITAATFNLLGGDFVCESGGTIHVKGKGETPVWYLLAENPANLP